MRKYETLSYQLPKQKKIPDTAAFQKNYIKENRFLFNISKRVFSYLFLLTLLRIRSLRQGNKIIVLIMYYKFLGEQFLFQSNFYRSDVSDKSSIFHHKQARRILASNHDQLSFMRTRHNYNNYNLV